MCPYRAPTDRQHQLATAVSRHYPASLSWGIVGDLLTDWLTDLPSKLMMWVWTSGGLANGAVSQDGCCDVNVTPFFARRPIREVRFSAMCPLASPVPAWPLFT